MRDRHNIHSDMKTVQNINNSVRHLPLAQLEERNKCPAFCANLAQNSPRISDELLVLERRRQRMVTPSVRQILCR